MHGGTDGVYRANLRIGDARETYSVENGRHDFKWRAELSVSAAQQSRFNVTFHRFEIHRGRNGEGVSRVPARRCRTPPRLQGRDREVSLFKRTREPSVAHRSESLVDEGGRDARYA